MSERDAHDAQAEELLPCRNTPGCSIDVFGVQKHSSHCWAIKRPAVAARLRDMANIVFTASEEVKACKVKIDDFCNSLDLKNLQVEIERLQQIEAENYSSLVEPLQELLGPDESIAREELFAFLESRMVHRPAANLRDAAYISALEAAKEVAASTYDKHRGSAFFTVGAIQDLITAKAKQKG